MSLFGKLRFGALAVAFLFALSYGTTANAKEFYKMSTLAPGSSAFLVMSTFADIVNKSDPNTEIQVNATGAATRHAIEAGRGEIDFFMSAPSVHVLMQRGVAMYAKVEDAPELSKNLRTIFNFPLGAYHVVVYADSGINSLADLKGKKVFLGPPGGGALRIAQQLVEFSSGLKPGEDFNSVKLGWAAAAQGFQDKRFDVYINPTLAPSPVIAQIALSNKIRFLGLTKAQLESEAMKPLLTRPGGKTAVIPVGIYGKNQVNESDVTTIASIVGLSTTADQSEEFIYQITKTFWEEVEKLRASAPWLERVNLEGAFDELNIPMHPGAIRYYREIGIDVPESAIPPS